MVCFNITHPFFLTEAKNKRFLLRNDLVSQSKLKQKSIDNVTVSTIPTDGISWIKIFWEPAAAQQNLCSCQHRGSTIEPPRICGSGQPGHRFPGSHRSWEPLHMASILPALTPQRETMPERCTTSRGSAALCILDPLWDSQVSPTQSACQLVETDAIAG